MLTLLFILCALIWLPIIFHQISNRGFFVFLIWLFIAPFVTNIVSVGGNPLLPAIHNNTNLVRFAIEESEKGRDDGYLTASHDNRIGIKQIFEPTRLLFFMFFCVYIFDYLREKPHQRTFNRTEVWMGVFSLILLASALFQSYRTHFGLRIVLDAFIGPFLAYYLARRYVTDEEGLRKLVYALGYTGFCLIVLALTERFLLIDQGLTYRLRGPFQHRDKLYIVIMTIFFTVLLSPTRSWSLSKRKWAFSPGLRRFVLVLSPIIIFLTFTRANWLAFLLALWLLAFMGHRLLNLSRKIGVIGLLLMFLPVIIIGIPVLMPEEIVERRVANANTVHARLAAWSIVVQEATQKPIFGIGLTNTRYLLHTTQQRFMTANNLTSTHNSPLTMLVELGAFGFLVYAAIVGSIISMGLRLYRKGPHPQDRWRGLCVIVIMVGYLPCTLFNNLIFSPWLGKMYVFAAIGGITGLYSPLCTAIASTSIPVMHETYSQAPNLDQNVNGQ